MSPYKYLVWEWVDEDGNPMYVGRGKCEAGIHPAVMVWKNRHTVNSDLNLWLRELKKEPTRNPNVGRTAMHKRESRAYAGQLRDGHRKANRVLLSKRPHGTTVGGGRKRAVISPDGDIFESVRAAADDLGLNPGTITRRCNKQTDGWRYLNDEDND